MNQKEIANAIMKQFADTNSKPNHIIQERWITQVLLRQLNPKEQEMLNPAINDLVNDGLITVEDRSGTCLVLTQKGFDTIYQIDEDKTIEKIGRTILKRFADTNSRVNHIIDFHWINMILPKGLNPKEIALIDAAISKLESDDLITTEDRHGFCMVLTQKGFDTIY
jgi:hypothetical protein